MRGLAWRTCVPEIVLPHHARSLARNMLMKIGNAQLDAAEALLKIIQVKIAAVRTAAVEEQTLRMDRIRREALKAVVGRAS